MKTRYVLDVGPQNTWQFKKVILCNLDQIQKSSRYGTTEQMAV